MDSPGSAVDKKPPANAGETDSIPGPGRSHLPQGNYPMCHNHRALARGLQATTTEAHALRACALQQDQPLR